MTVCLYCFQKNEQIGMSKSSYMEAVLDGIRAVETVEVLLLPSCGSNENLELLPNTNDAINKGKRRKLYVRLLLSIDRCESTASAMETVCLRALACILFIFLRSC